MIRKGGKEKLDWNGISGGMVTGWMVGRYYKKRLHTSSMKPFCNIVTQGLAILWLARRGIPALPRICFVQKFHLYVIELHFLQ